jgi:ADP-heptose:LPS heptosyltransferase
MKKNLLIRMDKIGDLVLTLPVDQVLDSKDQTVWFITQGLEFFPEHASPKRQFIGFKKQFSWLEFKRMYLTIKKLKPDRAIVFHAPWWVGLALLCAWVPTRVGVRSKWHSFLFFNSSLRQKRSRAEKHEAHYGLELVERATQQKFEFANLKPLSLSSGFYPEKLSEWGLERMDYIVVHPGMAGSALNWPISKYIGFIQEISKTTTVVVTCGPQDEKYVGPIRKEFTGHEKVKILEGLSLKELLLVLEKSNGVLAPSTGVLHLAASTGVPTLGIYSPVGVERALRWGPRGLNADTLTPVINNNNFDRETIMDTLSVGQVLNTFRQMMR